MIGAAKVGFLREKAPPPTVYTLDLTYASADGGFKLNADAAVPKSFEVAQTITVNGYSDGSCNTATGESDTTGSMFLASGSFSVAGLGTGDIGGSGNYKYTVGTQLSIKIDGGGATNRTTGVQWNEGGYGWIFNFDSDCHPNPI